MINTIKTSNTVKFGTAAITALSILLQNKDTIISSLGNPQWGDTAFVIVNILIVFGSSWGLSKYRKDGDNKPLIRDRTVIGF